MHSPPWCGARLEVVALVSVVQLDGAISDGLWYGAGAGAEAEVS